ncbi:MAG: hypothetical protein WC789_10520 [Lentisphaeria bacterium]
MRRPPQRAVRLAARRLAAGLLRSNVDCATGGPARVLLGLPADDDPKHVRSWDDERVLNETDVRIAEELSRIADRIDPDD